MNYLGIPKEYLVNFAVLAMAGHFAAIVKAPITGIILIFEMTGSFEHLLPLSVVVFSAMISSELLGVAPVYEMLLEDILKNKKGAKKEKEVNDKKTLLEISVHLGSEISIYRGNAEILPRGNIKLLAGDLLLVMVNSSESGEMFEFLSKISSNE